jgi:putative hydrolase of the HAD superfamily
VIYRAVAFDIDGTLYPSLALYLRNFGLGLRNQRMLRNFAKVRYDLHAMSMDPARRASMPRDLIGFRSLQARLLAEKRGIGQVEASAWVERVMYGELEASFGHVHPFGGVVAALEALAAAGLRLAALSDFPASNKLVTLGLRKWFEVATSSEESGFLKPAPEPFLDIAAKLCLDPAEILYVGNSMALDVAGAKGVGMGTALRAKPSLKPGFHEPYAPRSFSGAGRPAGAANRPDLVFSDWTKLVSFILNGS